jgi:hypothetical protein
MNIDEALRKIAAENNFTRLDVGIVTGHDGETYFLATVWGDGIGLHGCTSMNGDTVAEAFANTVRHAGKFRASSIPEIETDKGEMK